MVPTMGTVLVCGGVGMGKSAFCQKITDTGESEFKTSSDPLAETTEVKCVEGTLLGEAGWRVIDTPGLNEDWEADGDHVRRMVDFLRDQTNVKGIIVVLNGEAPRFDEPQKRALKVYKEVFRSNKVSLEDLADHMSIVFTRHRFTDDEEEEKRNRQKKRWLEEISAYFGAEVSSAFHVQLKPQKRDEKIDSAMTKFELDTLHLRLRRNRGLDLSESNKVNISAAGAEAFEPGEGAVKLGGYKWEFQWVRQTNEGASATMTFAHRTNKLVSKSKFQRKVQEKAHTASTSASVEGDFLVSFSCEASYQYHTSLEAEMNSKDTVEVDEEVEFKEAFSVQDGGSMEFHRLVLDLPGCSIPTDKTALIPVGGRLPPAESDVYGVFMPKPKPKPKTPPPPSPAGSYGTPRRGSSANSPLTDMMLSTFGPYM